VARAAQQLYAVTGRYDIIETGLLQTPACLFSRTFYAVLLLNYSNTGKCSKKLGHFQGLSVTFKDLGQIPGLSRPGKPNFKIQGLSRSCNNPVDRRMHLCTFGFIQKRHKAKAVT